MLSFFRFRLWIDVKNDFDDFRPLWRILARVVMMPVMSAHALPSFGPTKQVKAAPPLASTPLN